MKSAAEEIIREFNSSYFLKEFTFPGKKIKNTQGEDELSDGIIWLGDELILFQIKERGELSSTPSDETQSKWFKGSVLNIATRQIRESISLFDNSPEFTIENFRGQPRKLDFESVKTKFFVVIYNSRYDLPRECYAKKSHVSLSTGKELFIHIINAIDWIYLCRFLATLPEIFYYLDFRERCLRTLPQTRKEIEKWILGRYLTSPKVPLVELDGFPNDFSLMVDKLETKDPIHEKFGRIITSLYERLDPEQRSTESYYEMMKELAFLNRQLREKFIEYYELAENGNLKETNGFKTLTGALFAFMTGEKNNYDLPFKERIRELDKMSLYSKYVHRAKSCLMCRVYVGTPNFDYSFFSSAWETNTPDQVERLVAELHEKGLVKESHPIIEPIYRFR